MANVSSETKDLLSDIQYHPRKNRFFFQDYSNKVAIFQFWSKNVAWKWSWDQTRLIPNRTNITSCSLMFCFSEIRDGVMWTSVDFSISSRWLYVCSSHRWPLVLVSLNDESLLWLTFHAPDISTFFCGLHCSFWPIHTSLCQRIYAENLTMLHIVCPRRLSFAIWVKASMYLLHSVNIKQNHGSEVVVYHQFSNRWEHWSQGCCGLRALRDCRLRGKICVVLCGQSMPNPFSFLKVVFLISEGLHGPVSAASHKPELL